MIVKLRYLFVLMMVLTGCGSVVEEGSPLGQSFDSFRQNQADFVPRFITLLREEAPTLQVGFIQLETNGNLLLEAQDGDFAYWLSPDGAQIILQSGMLHSTRGLGEGLLASDVSQPLAYVLGMQSGWSDRFHTYLDGNDYAITRTYRCRIENEGPQEIDLFGTPVNTRLMRESCRSLDQDFDNLYWVASAGGGIILSRQWAGPEIGFVSTRIVPR